MIVELPELDDKVAENFGNFWKSPPTQRKYSVQPAESRSMVGSQADSFADKKRSSLLPDVGNANKTPDFVK